MSVTLPTASAPLGETAAAAFPPSAHGGLFTAAAEASPTLIAVFHGPSLGAVYLNGAGRAWLDPYGHAAVEEFTLSEIVGENDLECLRNGMLIRAETSGSWSGECVLRDFHGNEIAAHASLTSHPGGLLCLQAARAPVQTAEHAPESSDHELLHALLETLPDAVYFKDLHSRFIRVSRALATKLGSDDPHDLIGLTDFDRFAAEHARPAFEDEQRIIKTGVPMLDREEKETLADGRISWVSSTKLPLRDRGGAIVGTYGVSRDVTARKLAEQQNLDLIAQLQLAQKLESIGRLAAGIAHEINTPNQFITDNSHFLLGAFAQLTTVIEAYRSLLRASADHPALADPARVAMVAEQEQELDYLLGEIPKSINQSLEGLGRVARIVHSLKEFSHPGNTSRTPVDLNRIIENDVTISRHEWRYVADVDTALDPALPPVPCIADEFGQVILNLVINAAHAIETALKERGDPGARGTITIRTLRDASHAIIEIQDTGTGIPEEIRSRVFDPFFTTKEVGRGTGQGLAIAHTVVVQHHQGTIDFTSEMGRGTTFRIRLPLRAPGAGEAPAQPAA